MVDRLDSIRPQLTPRATHGRRTAAGLLLAAVVACARYEASASSDSAHSDSIRRAVQDSINRAQPGYVVDSLFPIEEELRRFNAGLERPTSLSGGGASRMDLVDRFVRALVAGDTRTLRSLLISRAEFGYFVFPESPYSRPPYKTKPGLIWMQLTSNSERGMVRMLDRLAHRRVYVSDLRCAAQVEREGSNRYWRDCTMLVNAGSGVSKRLQLFGKIIERDGRAKFVSYDTSF